MKTNKFFSRLMAMILSAALIFSVTPLTAAAEDIPDPGESGGMSTSGVTQTQAPLQAPGAGPFALDVDIDGINFPDPIFRAWVSINADTDHDGKLTALEIAAVTDMDVSNLGIGDLTGIGHFTALTDLICYANRLTALDVSGCTSLTILDCAINQLTALDVSGCTALTKLICFYNQLTALDVSGCTALLELDCSFSQLTALDVSKNTALSELNCAYSQLTALDVSNNTALTVLTCYSNQLTALDVSNNTALITLDCPLNQLTVLDVSNNTALTWLGCNNNQLTALDVSNNTALTGLYCSDNQLNALDVSNNTALEMLYAHHNTLNNLSGLKSFALSLNPLSFSYTEDGSNWCIARDGQKVLTIKSIGQGMGYGLISAPDITIWPVVNSGYSFLRWQDAVGLSGVDLTDSNQQYIASTSDTMSITAVFEGASSSSSPGKKSGGSGKNSGKNTAAPSSTWLEQGAAGALTSGAKGQNQDYARTKGSGVYGVRAAAWAKLAGLKYEHDTMDGNTVQVRVSIPEPGKVTKDLMVSGYVTGADVDRARSRFEKHYKNNLRVIHFDQQGAWGQPVNIAAKVDLTGMDTENLYFYAYDSKTNSYTRIENPAYFIDKNGYLHFTTELAGDIIISDGPLEKII